jgi:flagellar biosynthesis protein FlhG
MQMGEQNLWSVGAGKGGVGKTFLTAATGLLLARMGHSVILVDGALGVPSLHAALGVRSPRATLLDFLEDRIDEQEVLIATSEPGLRFLCCAADFLGAADPSPSQKQKILQYLSGLNTDFVLLDTGAGLSHNVLDFFNLSAHGIVISTPDPASMQNAYAFIKNVIYRRIQIELADHMSVHNALTQLRDRAGKSKPHTMMDFYDSLCLSDSEAAESVAALVDRFHPLLVVNKASSEEDRRAGEVLQATCKKYLNVDIQLGSLILTDPEIQKSSQKMAPPDLSDGMRPISQQIRQIVHHLLHCSGRSSTTVARNAEELASSNPIMGLNDNLEVMGNVFHIQTEDLGPAGQYITTQVFCTGQVVLSAKTGYPTSNRSRCDRMQIAELMRSQHFKVLRELESRKSRISQTVLPR